MYIDEVIRLFFGLLPIFLVLLMGNKKLFIAILILGFDTIYKGVVELFGDCFYCGIYDGTVGGIFYVGSLIIGIYAFVVLLKRSGIGFIKYNEEPSKKLALKKTKRFYQLVGFVLVLIVWLSFFFGNGTSELLYNIIPFVVKGPFFYSIIGGVLLQIIMGLLYYFVCLSEMKSRRNYVIWSTVFFVSLFLLYGLSLFFLFASSVF